MRLKELCEYGEAPPLVIRGNFGFWYCQSLSVTSGYIGNANPRPVQKYSYSSIIFDSRSILLHTTKINVSYRVFNCILVHFIPLPVFIFYSFTGIYILLILFLYSILSTLFPCTLYGLIFPFLFLYFYSIFVYSFSLFSVPAWMGLYRRGWDYTAWSVFV